MKQRWLILLLLISCPYVHAQEGASKEPDMQQVADDMLGTQEQLTGSGDAYENLGMIISEPLDLNTASREALRFLNILTEQQISALLQHRAENGQILSIYELQIIPGFDLNTINTLLPYIIIRDNKAILNASLIKRILTEKNNYFLLRHESIQQLQQGFTDDVSPAARFQGSPDKLYARFRNSRPGDFSMGLTLKKDAGEPIHWNSPRQYGADFYSFHLQLLNKGILKNIIVGDYQLQMGQGLVLGGVFGMGKGGETITTVRRSNIGALPYTASAENMYLRGVAATVDIIHNLSVTAFLSNAPRDASIKDTDSTGSFSISALQTTGYHRNENEISGRHAVTELNYGGIIRYNTNRVDAGVIFNTVGFNAPLNKRPTVYNQFTFTAQQSSTASFFLNYTCSNVTLFSETAKNFQSGLATITGLLTSLSKDFDVALVYRYYQRNFHTFYSNAFAESSTPQNESGGYWGWKYRIGHKYSLAGYVDLFRFPWLRYRSYAPSEGHEWLIRFNFQPSRSSIFYMQMREESKVRNLNNTERSVYATAPGIKRNYLLYTRVSINKTISLSTRVQMSSFSFNRSHTSGFAIMQDIRWDVGKLSFTARHALFDTDDYDNRQYVYENDVWLAFSFPAYDGVGVRNYIMMRYKINRHISLWVRYARTRYTDRNTIGSGVDMIEGNIKSDVKVQLKISL